MRRLSSDPYVEACKNPSSSDWTWGTFEGTLKGIKKESGQIWRGEGGRRGRVNLTSLGSPLMHGPQGLIIRPSEVLSPLMLQALVRPC